MSIDPMELAVSRFGVSDAEPHVASLDVIRRTATDPPLVMQTLIDAARPAALDGARICELGFGTGWLLEQLPTEFPRCDIIGIDMAPAMARRARDRHGGDVDVMLGDMQRLPLFDAVLDAVLTCWTLYFMPDIGATLDEIRRAVRPGGRVIAATNARDHMIEYTELATEALSRVLGREPETDVAERFDLISGEPLMRAHFDDVDKVLWDGDMILRDAADAALLWDAYGTAKLAGQERQSVIDEVVRLIGQRIAAEGGFRIRRRGVAFVATV